MLVGCYEIENFLGELLQEDFDMLEVFDRLGLLGFQNLDGLGNCNWSIFPLSGIPMINDNEKTGSDLVSIHLKHLLQLLVLPIFGTARRNTNAHIAGNGFY